jgi:hypothetical protein
MTEAAREFEDRGEAEDWSVAQQKLALAYRGAGNLAEARRLITIAGSSGPTGTRMQKVRLSTAKAHILLSDTGTRIQGGTAVRHPPAQLPAPPVHPRQALRRRHLGHPRRRPVHPPRLPAPLLPRPSR